MAKESELNFQAAQRRLASEPGAQSQPASDEEIQRLRLRETEHTGLVLARLRDKLNEHQEGITSEAENSIVRSAEPLYKTDAFEILTQIGEIFGTQQSIGLAIVDYPPPSYEYARISEIDDSQSTFSADTSRDLDALAQKMERVIHDDYDRYSSKRFAISLHLPVQQDLSIRIVSYTNSWGVDMFNISTNSGYEINCAVVGYDYWEKENSRLVREVPQTFTKRVLSKIKSIASFKDPVDLGQPEDKKKLGLYLAERREEFSGRVINALSPEARDYLQAVLKP